jgi:hypothetical protein
MKDYCEYEKNYPALADLLFTTPYLLSITLFIYGNLWKLYTKTEKHDKL